MEDVQAIINRLRTRIAGILAERSRVEFEYRKSLSEKGRLLAEKQALEDKNAELERRIKVLELTNGVTGLSGGSKSARDRVNKLLREIDKCIALMNR